MLDRLRTLKPAAARTVAAGVVALGVSVVPGTTPPAHADQVVDYRVLPGTVLTPLPPTWVLPVRGYRLTGRFGDVSGLWSSVHTGLDFAAPAGTPIRAVGAGVITSAGYDGSYGQKTVLTLASGTELWFCHQSAVDVVVGQWVVPGQVIGAVGSTGNVTGPHLHLEVRPAVDDPIDPDAWLHRHALRP
ncbi:M23 family metallopeptidase [Nocardioides marmoriginsengisoli]|uniref:M23 family metallopeptidase n=1 Tax=Nocardioides marmoriginsengisoli TaxID=661483 RepID=A0A3N0CS07_9ACTN|nr:M23 family metallopeptidase [Nocardioides marmoriginsengisoli]RNL65786.1 M23 family metallopeptidase [Nocardioides marmoriginsengisoli]